ncbi:MAG: biotin--[acetyl-CoA-carboxylase] ligase [Spirochaetaceae bacterium]|nr:biotin--[acetyl-CoA-carboxylase] ligase [Spirochaetaceae bacterium]
MKRIGRLKRLDVANPFGAPVYRLAVCASTMDEARWLLSEGATHGTAIATDLQTGGRGRYPERTWVSSAGKNLMFTLILRYPDFSRVPEAITLRFGLAVARAIADFEPDLASALAVKWPNDVMLGNKKCAGLLTENNGGTVLAGIGINVAEKFSEDGPTPHASSIACELAAVNKDRAAIYVEPPLSLLLEKTLFFLHDAVSPGFDGVWREELERMLYMKGRNVRFAAGTSPARVVNGVIAGIRADGALLIVPEGGTATEAFMAGELDVYGAL